MQSILDQFRVSPPHNGVSQKWSHVVTDAARAHCPSGQPSLGSIVKISDSPSEVNVRYLTANNPANRLFILPCSIYDPVILCMGHCVWLDPHDVCTSDDGRIKGEKVLVDHMTQPCADGEKNPLSRVRIPPVDFFSRKIAVNYGHRIAKMRWP